MASSKSAGNSADLASQIRHFDCSTMNPTTTVETNFAVVENFGSRIDIANTPNEEEVQEYFDSDEVLEQKAEKVAQFIQNSKNFVIYTGAGVSTSANIPDYRGPNGVWTLRAKGLVPASKVPLDQAQPTFSHMAMVQLINKGYLKFVVSTNCDGLHRRSGVLREHLAELHGNIYLERCIDCEAEFLRFFDVRKHKRQFIQAKRLTGRLCERVTPSGEQCRGKLRDTIVNFGENLPVMDLDLATRYSEEADLVMVFGSSMRVQPSCDLPSMSYMHGGRFCLCNLQRTQYDDQCERSNGQRIWARCDDFMKLLMKNLHIQVPEFTLTSEIIEESVGNIIEDPECDTDPMVKYNVHSMADDGPPPEAVLDQIKSGFIFRRHIIQDR